VASTVARKDAPVDVQGAETVGAAGGVVHAVRGHSFVGHAPLEGSQHLLSIGALHLRAHV